MNVKEIDRSVPTIIGGGLAPSVPALRTIPALRSASGDAYMRFVNENFQSATRKATPGGELPHSEAYMLLDALRAAVEICETSLEPSSKRSNTADNEQYKEEL